ncbi:glutathione S-transferase T3-like [Arachis stenosperma]|uniref:glutathione S-transferase T3-like n=1 Tax=Arachis stenosperma TaxID=217475 RepID=UPI0025AB9158|nr:glutathione S-transferase T3-like [Arachis stenosperma]
MVDYKPIDTPRQVNHKLKIVESATLPDKERNVAPTSLPFSTQFSASRHSSFGVGGSFNPSPQTPIQCSPNSQYSDFANPRGLDAIDLNEDDFENRRQDSIQHWQWEEDEILISAWLNISTDPIVGTNQKGETFWSRIHIYYVEFNSDIKREKFTFERHWNILRLEQKWRSQLPTQSGGSKRTKVGATGAYSSSSSNLEAPLCDETSVDSPVRPQGSKKSKRKGKEKTQMSEDLSKKKSSVAKKLSLLEDIKNVREKELMDRKKEREEEKEHRKKKMSIKEKELQIQAGMKVQELQTQRYIKEMEINVKEREMERMAKKREREIDMQILNADTSTMSEKRRALHEIACEKIINK